MLIFWKKYAVDLPTWARVADNVALIATSSADAERGFSIYDGCLSDQQKSSKEDKSEATVMIRHNETKRRLEMNSEPSMPWTIKKCIRPRTKYTVTMEVCNFFSRLSIHGYYDK